MRRGVYGGLFDLLVLEEREGFISLEISGKDVSPFFNEGGGHRFQRIPPTEHRGRIHTSTVTVAVIHPVESSDNSLDLRQVDITTTHGSGPGGQNKNKVETCVVAIHRPTGEKVRVDVERSQLKNKELALSILSAKVLNRMQTERAQGLNNSRRLQIGSGERGDKIRTYRAQDDKVVDHRTGQTWRLSKWLKGEF